MNNANSASPCQTDYMSALTERYAGAATLKRENLRLRSLLDESAMSNKGLARRVVDLES